MGLKKGHIPLRPTHLGADLNGFANRVPDYYIDYVLICLLW